MLRALVEGDDSQLQGTLARADAALIAFASKSRPAPVLTPNVNIAPAKSNIASLEADIARLTKRAVNLTVGVTVPKNAARDLKEIAAIAPQLKDKTATITVNRAGNADPKQLRDLARIATTLKDKTVTITVNWAQNGAPPVIPPGGAPVPPGGPRPPGPVPPGGNGSGNGGFGGGMQGMQSRGYYGMASGAMLTGMVTAPVIGLGKKALDFAGDYEEAMQHVVTLTDVSKTELEGLMRQVISLSADPQVRQGPAQLAEALYYVTSTGLKGADGMKVLKAAAYGASAGLGDTKVVANTLTTVLDAYGLSADQAMRSTDTLTQAVKFGKGEADKYAAAFPKVIAIAAQAGVSFEEVAAQMASATRLGLTPSETATALRQIFSNIIDPSEKAKEAMKSIGTSVGELRIALKDKQLFAVLKDLMERTGGRIGPITELFGSIRALTSFLSTNGTKTAQEYFKTLKATTTFGNGATFTAAETASETYRFSLDKLQGSIERTGISLGNRLIPQMADASKWLETNLPNAVENTVQAWNGLDAGQKKVVAGLAALILAAGPIKLVTGNLTILASILGGSALSATGGLGLIRLATSISSLVKVAGGLGVVSSLYTSTAAAAAATAAGGTTVAAGFTAVGTAAAGLGITLLALVPIFLLVGAAYYEYQAKLGDIDIAQHNAKMSAESLQKSIATALKVASGSGAAKTALRKIADDATAAGSNTTKLLAVLEAAVKAKREIGLDVKLSASAKAIAQSELQRFINNLSAQAIELKVDVATVQRAAGRETPETRVADVVQTGEQKWAERAKRAGLPAPVAWSQQPPSTVPEPSSVANMFGLTAGKMRNDGAEQAFFAKRREEENAIVTWELKNAAMLSDIARAQEDDARRFGRNQGAVTAHVQAQSAAIKEQTKAVSELTDAELAREQKRVDKAAGAGALTLGNPKFDANTYDRAKDISEERARRKKEADERAKTTREANKERDTQAEEARIKAAEETAQRLLAIETQNLQDRLNLWNTFGNAVEGVVSQLGKVGAEKSDTAKLAAQAQMAKREFADIPPHLKATVIGIAAINDEMKRLTETRDTLRSLFGDMFKDTLRAGADTSGIVKLASEWETALNFKTRMESGFNRGQDAAGRVVNFTEHKRAGLSSRIEANQGAMRKSGRTFDGDVYSEGGTGALQTARGMLGVGMNDPRIMATGAEVFGKKAGDEWCVGFIQAVAKANVGKTIANGTLSVGSLRQWGKNTGKDFTGKPSAGDIMTVQRGQRGKRGFESHTALVDKVWPDGTFSTIGGNEGAKNNHQSRVKDAGRYRYDDPAVRFIRGDVLGRSSSTPAPAPKPVTPDSSTNAVSAPKPQVSTSTMVPVGSNTARRAAAVPVLPGKPVRPYGKAATPNFNGDLLQLGLPKGWGRAVTEQNMKPGESRTWQLKIQDMLLDTEKASKLAGDLGMSLDQFAGKLRVAAVKQDRVNDTAKAVEATTARTRELSKEAHFARRGEQTDLGEFFYDAGKGAYNRTPRAQQQKIVGGIIGNDMAQARRETEDARRDALGRRKVVAAGTPFIEQGDVAGAERAQALAQIRVDAWNNEKRQKERADAKTLRDQAKRQRELKTPAGMANANRNERTAQNIERNSNEQFRKQARIGEADMETQSGDRARKSEVDRSNGRADELVLARAELKRVRDGLNEAARARVSAVDRATQSELRTLEKDSPTLSKEERERRAGKVGVEAGTAFDVQSATEAENERRAFHRDIGMRERLLKAQLELNAALPVESRELQLQLKLAEERGKLESQNLALGEGEQINVEGRMRLLEAQLRGEERLFALQSRRATLNDADVFDENSLAKRGNLGQQMNLIGSLPSDSPELAIQLRLLEERGKVEEENRVRRRTGQAEINGDRRLSTLEAELRAEDALARLQTARANISSAQNTVLDAELARAQSLVSTERERLALAFKYEDIRRAKVGIETLPEEQRAREQQLELSADAERLARLREGAAGLEEAFRTSVEAGLKDPLDSIPSMIQSIAATMKRELLGSISRELTQKVVGKEAMPDKPEEGLFGAVLDRVKGRGKGNGDAAATPASPALNSAPESATDGFFKQILSAGAMKALGGSSPFTPGFVPQVRETGGVSDSGNIVSAITGALNGGITAASVTVQAPSAQVNAANVNVAGGASGAGSLLGGLFGGGNKSSGKAGSTPTAQQQIETVDI